jgi:hypothetical protein
MLQRAKALVAAATMAVQLMSAANALPPSTTAPGKITGDDHFAAAVNADGMAAVWCIIDESTPATQEVMVTLLP